MKNPTELSRVFEQRREPDFGLRDPQGRAFGATLELFTVDLCHDQVPANDRLPNGVYYTFVGMVVRDGEPFGSGRTMLRYFATRAEREATIAHYLHHARRRIRQRIKSDEAILRASSAAQAASISAKPKAKRAISAQAAAEITAALIARLRRAPTRG